MTTGGAERDTDRLARRVVLMIQRIAGGEDPAGFEVGFPTSQRLVINMHTARAIGFSPRWQFLADAEQIQAESADAQPLTMIEAMRAALDANPSLEASRERLGSALEDVRIARSELLPSLGADAAARASMRTAPVPVPGRGHHRRGPGILPAPLLRTCLGGLFDFEVAGRGAGREPAHRLARHARGSPRSPI